MRNDAIGSMQCAELHLKNTCSKKRNFSKKNRCHNFDPLLKVFDEMLYQIGLQPMRHQHLAFLVNRLTSLKMGL